MWGKPSGNSLQELKNKNSNQINSRTNNVSVVTEHRFSAGDDCDWNSVRIPRKKLFQEDDIRNDINLENSSINVMADTDNSNLIFHC